MNRTLKVAALVALVAVCGTAGVWGTGALMSQGSDNGEGDAEPSPTRVGVAHPEARTLEDSFSAVGTILAARSIELRPLAEGRIVELGASSGEEVEAGDLVFRLDDRAARAALFDAQATLAEARAEFERVEELADDNVAADAQLEEARGAYRRAEAAVALAEAELEDRRLLAPFDGILGIVDIDPGEYVDSATEVSSLEDLSTVQAEFALPERYFDRTRAGQSVRLSSALYPERPLEGRVSVKSPRIDRGSRSFNVRVSVDNPERLLTSGMFVSAELIFDTYEAPTVPDDAIISEGETTYVYIVADGAASRTEVEVGSSQDGRTEIAAGLDADDRVVVTGWDTLSDGAPVEIAEGELPSEALN